MLTKNEVKEEQLKIDKQMVEAGTQKSLPSIWYT